MTRTAWIALCLAGIGYAQQPAQLNQLGVAKRRAERSLQSVDSRLQRLIDMRMRHDLGLLLTLDEDVVAVDGETSALAMDRMRNELAELNARNTVLAADYEAVRSMVADLHQKAVQPSSAGADVEAELLIPTPGTRVVGDAESELESGDEASARRPSAPRSDRVADANQVGDVVELGPVVTLIHGSSDHHLVARALFKAGQALMDRAERLRREGRSDAAKKTADAAKDRLERAVVELRPLTESNNASFASLFFTSRCLELLFRYDERYEGLSLGSNRGEFQRRAQAVRDPLLRILSPPEDSNVPSDAEWRQAAKTADEHFRWMNINATYDASDEIEALTWPGRAGL